MVSQVERVMARRQVEAMIEADPVVITPYRRELIPDGAGGFKSGEYQEKTPVVCTFVPAKRRLALMTQNTELGDVINYPYTLLTFHTSDLKRDDRFSWNGEEFEVKFLNLKEEQEIVAWVDYYGGEQNA